MTKPDGVEIGSYLGGIVSILSSLTMTDVGIIFGIITALLTFAVNVIYTYRKDQREQVQFEQGMKDRRRKKREDDHA